MKKFRRKVLDMLMSNNSGSSLRQQLLDGAPFRSSLLYTAVPQRAASGTTATFTRATTSTWPNNDGYMVTGVAGEIGFVGGRRVYNALQNASIPSQDFSVAAWAASGVKSVTANYATAPDGTTTADRVVIAAGDYLRANTNLGSSSNSKTWLGSVYVKATSGTQTFRILLTQNGVANNYSSDLVATSEWQRFSFSIPFTSGGSGLLCGIADKAAGGGTDLVVWGYQVEDVTAQTTQTAGEYVSVGALDYRSELNPLYLSLPGTAGHYASTPDSAANSITGDIDIRVQVSPSSWTGGAAIIPYAAKFVTAGNQRAWLFATPIGQKTLVFYHSADGISQPSATSTSNVPFSDGQTGWIRVTRTKSNGFVFFYTSTDGVTWTQLGNAGVVNAGFDTFDSNAAVEVGAYATGITPVTGKIYSAQIYNTIGGTTPVVDFNPHRDATTPTGTITSSTTGEVWTINGASSVVRNATYHGSFVDGVKCFPTDLAGNALPTAYTYDAVSLNGVAGTYVSTPDSVAASITGDIDIRVAFTTTSLTTDQVVISKTTAAAGNKSWVLYLNNAGKMQGLFYHDGTNLAVNFAASVTLASLGFSANSRIDVRATYQTSSSILTWYYSTDSGATWTSMGASSFVGVAGIFDGNAPVELGTQFAGTSLPLSGKIYRAQIYNGINGTLAVDFDASRYAGGTTLTGSTGETWTLQGNAVIHPTNQPLLGYSAEGARTNLCLQSNAFTTTWTLDGLTPVQDAIGPDGATSAWTFTDNSAVAGERIYQSAPLLTAAAYTLSVFIKKTTGAQTGYPVIDFYPTAGTANFAGMTVDTTNGIATAWTARTGFTMASGISANCVSYNDSFWRVSLTVTGTASNYYVVLYPAGTTNPTQSTGALDATAQGSAVFYGAQVELGSFATSYIPTTTTAATRNADVLTYSSAGNASTSALWLYAELKPAYQPADLIAVTVDDGSNNNRVTITESASGGQFSPFIASGGVTQYAPLSAGAMSTSSSNKVVVTMSALGAGAATNAELLTTTGAITPPASFTTIRLSGRATGDFHWFGTIRNVRIGQRQLSASELGAITS